MTDGVADAAAAVDAPLPQASGDPVSDVLAAAISRPQLIGVVLAIAGNLVISIALALTKYAHNKNAEQVEPLPYTRLPLWWLGLTLTVVGEFGNFAAYGFAGASLIAPLGAVSVLANCFIAAIALGESLRCRDLTGCLLCVAGGCVVVLSTPERSNELDPSGFLQALQAPVFVLYIMGLLVVVMWMLGYRDQYGHKHVAYFVLLCSLLGSVTVLSSKGVSTFLNLWLCCGAPSPFTQPVLYPLVLVLAVTAVLQIRFLNEAMERFGNQETVPVYYVLFTLCTIVGSNILYRDFENEDAQTILSFALGCVLTFGGVKLLTSRRQRPASRRSSAHDISTTSDDTKCVPMLSDVYPVGVGSGAPAAAPAPAAFEPEALAVNFDDEVDDRMIATLNSPLAMTGDVLRRTFSARLATFTDRAVNGMRSSV